MVLLRPCGEPPALRAASEGGEPPLPASLASCDGELLPDVGEDVLPDAGDGVLESDLGAMDFSGPPLASSANTGAAIAVATAAERTRRKAICVRMIGSSGQSSRWS
jgi:hypothetical protein